MTSFGSSEIARSLRFLMRRDRVNVNQLSIQTGIPASTLYAMLKKSSNEANVIHLKKIAEFFGESLDIFCGLDSYVRPAKVAADEAQILSYYRGMNSSGRSRLLEYAAEVGENPRYQKEAAPAAEKT